MVSNVLRKQIARAHLNAKTNSDVINFPIDFSHSLLFIFNCVFVHRHSIPVLDTIAANFVCIYSRATAEEKTSVQIYTHEEYNVIVIVPSKSLHSFTYGYKRALPFLGPYLLTHPNQIY